jgi:hypothetical protein
MGGDGRRGGVDLTRFAWPDLLGAGDLRETGVFEDRLPRRRVGLVELPVDPVLGGHGVHGLGQLERLQRGRQHEIAHDRLDRALVGAGLVSVIPIRPDPMERDDPDADHERRIEKRNGVGKIASLDRTRRHARNEGFRILSQQFGKGVALEFLAQASMKPRDESAHPPKEAGNRAHDRGGK